jgi:DNA-binding CsgD family transcriptional regulator
VERYREILDFVSAGFATKDARDFMLATLKFVSAAVGAEKSDFWIYDPDTGLVDGGPVLLGLSRAAIDEYLSNYLLVDELRRAYYASGLRVARLTDLVDYSDWLKHSEYYRDFVRPFGLDYQILIELSDDTHAYGAVLFARGTRKGDFGLEDVSFVEDVYPHLVNRLRWQYWLKKAASPSPGHAGALPEEARAAVSRVPERGLTDRESEVAVLAMGGHSNEEIAHRLGITVNTVRMHLKHVFSKLGITRRSQLAAVYLAWRS